MGGKAKAAAVREAPPRQARAVAPPRLSLPGASRLASPGRPPNASRPPSGGRPPRAAAPPRLPIAAAPPKAPSRGPARQPPATATATTTATAATTTAAATAKHPSGEKAAAAAPSPGEVSADDHPELSAVAASHALLAEQSAALDLEQLRREPPPQGVVVAVRVRPMGTVAREHGQAAVVAMEGKVTRVHHPDKDGEGSVHPFSFDHSYWSSDGCTVGADGTRWPDGDASRYASQETVWRDLGPMVLGNAFNGIDATVMAYGQTGSGKTYSVFGQPPELGLVPRLLHALFDLKGREERGSDLVKYEIEIAMLEIYMEEVYNLLLPRDERRPLKVVILRGREPMIYNPTTAAKGGEGGKAADKGADATTAGKGGEGGEAADKGSVWNACVDYATAEALRSLGETQRTVRPTALGPASSRGHALFILRLSKRVREGADGAWRCEFRSNLSY